MIRGEVIAYCIQKKCQEYSLKDLCETYGFSTEDFFRFLELGEKAFNEETQAKGTAVFRSEDK